MNNNTVPRQTKTSCCSLLRWCADDVGLFVNKQLHKQFDQQVYTNWDSIQDSLEVFSCSQLFFFQGSCVSAPFSQLLSPFNKLLTMRKYNLSVQTFGWFLFVFVFSNLVFWPSALMATCVHDMNV